MLCAVVSSSACAVGADDDPFAALPNYKPSKDGPCDWGKVRKSRAVATVQSVTGDVGARSGERDWCDAVVGLKLIVNDEIHTGPDSSTGIIFFDGSVVNVYQLSETAIGDMSGAAMRP